MQHEGDSSSESSSQVRPRTVAVVILTAVALLGGLYLLWRVRDVIIWCVMALFTAAALAPAVNLLERCHMKRITAILVAYLGLLLATIGTIALLVPLLVTQIKSLAHLAIAVSQNPEEFLGRAWDIANRFRVG